MTTLRMPLGLWVVRVRQRVEAAEAAARRTCREVPVQPRQALARLVLVAVAGHEVEDVGPQVPQLAQGARLTQPQGEVGGLAGRDVVGRR